MSGTPDLTVDAVPNSVPELPAGMTVDGVILFHIRIGSPVTRGSPVRLRATTERDGEPESGQWLESIACGNAGGVLQVAIRDDEWLAVKGVVAEPVQYERRGFVQTINDAPAGTTLHASVAWRLHSTATANDDSTWFAADLALPG